MNFVNEYIKYLSKSKGRHGIHSPFTFNFVDKCLRIKIPKDLYDKINQIKKTLNTNNLTIKITDAGAGSKKLSNERSIKSIYKTASCKGVYAKLLFQLTDHYKPQNVLELGTSLGIGTIHLALGNSDANITTVDACYNTLKIAKENFNELKIRNINAVNSTFTDFLKNQNQTIFDLVYIDGHHQGNALTEYLDLLVKFTHDDTIFVLDDIRWNQDMFETWKTICNREEFHLTLDLFRMGIVIRRPQQFKEHFVIKLKNVLSGF